MPFYPTNPFDADANICNLMLKTDESGNKQLTTEENDLVLDPFLGSGTSAIVSKKLNRGYIGIEIDQKYMDLSKELLENLNNLE